MFERNILDRAHVLSIEYSSRESKHTIYNQGRDTVSYERLPKSYGNMFIEPKNKPFANINGIIYNFNEISQITLKKLGAQADEIYVFDGETEK